MREREDRCLIVSYSEFPVWRLFPLTDIENLFLQTTAVSMSIKRVVPSGDGRAPDVGGGGSLCFLMVDRKQQEHVTRCVYCLCSHLPVWPSGMFRLHSTTLKGNWEYGCVSAPGWGLASALCTGWNSESWGYFWRLEVGIFYFKVLKMAFHWF